MIGIGKYVLLAAVLYGISCFLPSWGLTAKLGINTILLFIFIAYLIKKDFPLGQMPVIGHYFNKKINRVMKNKLIILISLILCLGKFTANAGEGMWILGNLDKRTIQQMKALGLELSSKELYNTKGTSLKDAVISFGGFCTGVVVSSDGLVFTNHHCGFESIQSHSTINKDLIKNGFCSLP